jgi:tripartite ATP-independent transporter DctP family solute receptor
MHRRRALATVAALAGGSGWTRARAAGATLRLGHQFPRESLPDRIARRLADQVARLSGGALRVEVWGEATFGDERQHVALLRRGSLDLALTGDLVVGSLDAHWLVVNMPFLYRDGAHAMAVYDGAIGQELREAITERGLTALAWHHVGLRLLSARRAVHGLADLQGLRLRLPPDPAWSAVWRSLGAMPVTIPFPELPAALRLGTAEAQENPPDFIRTARLHEHQTHLMSTRHMPQRQFLLTGSARWQALAPPAREWLRQAATEAAQWGREAATTAQRSDVAWLTGPGGLQPVAFDPQGIAAQLPEIARRLGGEAGLALFTRIRETP